MAGLRDSAPTSKSSLKIAEALRFPVQHTEGLTVNGGDLTPLLGRSTLFQLLKQSACDYCSVSKTISPLQVHAVPSPEARRPSHPRDIAFVSGPLKKMMDN